MIFTKRSFLIVLVLCLSSLVLSSCTSEKKRPFGYLRIGFMEDFLFDEVYLSEHSLLVRRDEGGISVMSTRCTYDLSALVMTTSGPSAKFISKESSSEYAYDGSVLTGPAKSPLPYYEVLLEARDYSGPPNTLYVKVAIEKDKGWRMRIPMRFLPDDADSVN